MDSPKPEKNTSRIYSKNHLVLKTIIATRWEL